MKKMFKRTISCLLFTTVLGTAVLSSCKKKETETSEVELWTTYSTQKILKDGKYDYDVKFEPKVSLTMAQGEYEGAQLIMTPEVDVPYYNATISDLTNVETGEIYSKDRVEIYKQEYMYIASIVQQVDNLLPGYYPDALIPLEAVVNYGENTITAGDNQGLYLRFSTRPELDENDNPIVKDANATEDKKRYSYVSSGTYTGTVTLDFKTHTQSVPVTLTIVDATVSETAHAKTDFGTYPDYFGVDLNWTQEAYENYNKKLLEYRISGSQALVDKTYGEKGDIDQVEALWEILINPRCSSWTWKTANGTYGSNFFTDEEASAEDFEETRKSATTKMFTKQEYLDLFSLDNEYYAQSFKEPEYAEEFRVTQEDGTIGFVKLDGEGSEYAYDESLKDEPAFYVKAFHRTLWMLINKCLENNVNVLDKLIFEVNAIDEAWAHNRQAAVRACATLFKGTLVSLAEILTAEEDPTLTVWSKDVTLKFSESTVTKEEILQSVLRMQLLFTGNYSATYRGIIETWCPLSKHYGSEHARENYYGDQEEKWWYPVDDAPGVSPTIEVSTLYTRIAGWMMADYDITGLLYWAANCFYDKMNNQVPLDEFFTTNYMRYTSNGNGYFLYPGGQYELDEFIPSLRLEAFRDGLEEWELFYNIKETYNNISDKIGYDFDASKIIQSLGTTLYAQDKIINDNVAFAAARTSLLQLASCAESSANMCIVDYTDDTYGNQNYKIYANEGVSISNQGQVLTNVVQTIEGVGKVYSLNVPLVSATNSLNLSYTCDGIAYNYVQNLGGKVDKYSVGSDILATDFVETSDVSFSSTLVDQIEGQEGNAIKITVGESNEPSFDDKVQYFKFTNDLFKTELQDGKKVVIHLYNAQDTDLNIIVYGKQHGVRNLRAISETTLQQGDTTLEITLPSGDWSKNYLEYFDFCIGEGETATTAKTLYVKDVVIYKK